jgi:hypothetical protein
MGRLAEGGLTAAAGPVLNAPAVAVFVVSSLAAVCEEGTTAVAVAAARRRAAGGTWSPGR